MKDWIFFFIILWAWPIYASEDCQISETLEVSNMPPRRVQGPVGFCYAFSAITVLDQFHCKRKPNGCKYGMMSASIGEAGTPPGPIPKPSKSDGDKLIAAMPDDRLSVLDAISLSNQGQLIEGGFANEVLEKIQKQGRLALEKCALYERILYAQHTPDPKGNVSWWDRLKEAHAHFQTESQRLAGSPAALCQIAESTAAHIQEITGLSSDIEQISQALSKKNFQEFVRSATIPVRCESNRVKLPPFQVRIQREGSPTKTSPKITELIQKDTPVSVSICTTRHASQGCGAHEVTLAGMRKKCCQGRCVSQYKLADSAELFWTQSGNRNDKWVDADDILKRIERIQQSFPLGKGGTLTWLEER